MISHGELEQGQGIGVHNELSPLKDQCAPNMTFAKAFFKWVSPV